MIVEPWALAACLDQPTARLLDARDRRALAAALARARRVASPAGDVIAAEGHPIGRILPHGSVVLYRPESATPLRDRVLDVDAGGTVTATFDRDPHGGLRAAWVTLARDEVIGLLPGDATHPLWGPSDRVVRRAPEEVPAPITVSGAVAWGAVDTIPPVAEPARLPADAGAALLNVLAAIAWDQGRPALRYRGPYPTEQLFWSLTESFRFTCLESEGDPLPRFLGDAEATFARGAAREAPVDWIAAPHERRLHADGVVAQLRDGVERVSWRGRSYHRTERQGLRRREHRVVRVDGVDGVRRYVAGLEALGTAVEDHLVLDERADILDRLAPEPESGPDSPVAGPWRDALGVLLLLEATPLLAGAIEAVWRGLTLVWGPTPGDLVEARGTAIRLSPKLARVYRRAWAAAPPPGRRTVAQQLVREVLGLIGPPVRTAAARWLESLPEGRQETALAQAARRDRVQLAQAALAPLGRLLDAVAAGAALPE